MIQTSSDSLFEGVVFWQDFERWSATNWLERLQRWGERQCF
jgi:hypothetical protein